MNFTSPFHNTDFLVSPKTIQAPQNTFNAIFNYLDAKNANSFFLPINFQNQQNANIISLLPTRANTDMSSVSQYGPQETQYDENSSISEDFTQTRDDKQAVQSESSPEAKSNAQGSLEDDNNSPITNFEDFLNIEDEEEREMLISKGWKSSDDQTLLGLAQKYKCDWKKISKKFDNKKFTPYFLKIRYKELIDAPVQKKHKFTEAEDLLLAKLFKTLGSNWNEIAKQFKNRTGVMLKNRYYSYIRKRGLLDDLVSKAESQHQQNHQESQTTINRIVKQVMQEIKVQETFIEKKEDLKVVDFSEFSFSQTFYEFEGFNDDALHTKITPMEYDENAQSFYQSHSGARQNMQQYNYGYNYTQQHMNNGYHY